MTQTHTPPTAEQLLGGGGASWKPEEIGDKIVGYITDIKTAQQTEPGPERKLRTYKDGSPMWQIIVTLQTDEIDPDIDDDDGARRVYASYEGQKALKAACKAAGVKSIAVGGKLLMQVSGTHKNPYGGKPVKEYRARYKAPDPAADVLAGVDDEQYTGETDEGFDETPKAAPAKKAPAKKAAAKAAAPAVSEYTEDDDPGF